MTNSGSVNDIKSPGVLVPKGNREEIGTEEIGTGTILSREIGTGTILSQKMCSGK
jgi:hypothetical protein